MIRALSFALAAAVTVAGALPQVAVAQEAISTAAGDPAAPAPVSAADAPPITLPEAIGPDDAGPLPVGPCGAVGQIRDGQVEKPDKNPHGEVWAGVGTHGYRETGGVVCQPIGDHSSVTIAVDAAHIGR